ncbi:hypothetical protein DPV78_001137 [Talaromyces pinophilus]|nr:hypothetical protein DPV78_001137 [Talaromyces pinophilus]
MSQRRQYSSCDSCRRSKRRCSFSGPSEGEMCTNCRRLGHACTFEFAKSRRAMRERLRRSRSHSHLSINRNALPEIAGNGLSSGSKSQTEADPLAFPDTLVPWLNFDEGHSNEVNCHDNVGLDLTDLLMSDTVPPTQALTEAQLSLYNSPLNRGRSITPILPGSSLSSPIRLLNSQLDATILDDRLVRIHNAIITGCASRFADYNCNLFATASRYRIEGWDGASTQNRSPQSELGVAPMGVACTLTAIGAVRFLDHFGGLYGNQLSAAARKQSDAALKAVLRTFSLQWLSTSEGKPAADSTRDASRNAFYDSWFKAREILRDVQSVRSFRIVYAILLFDGIATPTQASARSLHEFLDTGLQTLSLLDALVKKYCTTLGVHSTYGMLLETSMTLVRWGGYIRDIGASLTTYRQCTLPPVSCHGKELFTMESAFDWLKPQNLPSDLDARIPSICQKAVAEAFSLWRQIVEVKNFLHRGLPSACLETIASTVAAVSKFNQLFRPFINHCINNLECLSIHSRVSSVSIALFWELSVLILDELLDSCTRENDPVYDFPIINMHAYRAEVVSSVANIVGRVLSLPTEQIFNLENGLDAEVPILAYHITPSLTATVFQKTIERLIHSENLESCAANSLGMDPVRQRQIDIVMKGLSSLSVTAGGSEVATAVLQSIMSRHGDILCECWTSDFST